MSKLKYLVVSFLVVALVYGFGGLFAGETDSEWFDSIRPSLSPPDWVFGVVWPVLYILIALSLYFAWTGSKKTHETKVSNFLSGRREVAWSYGSNLVLNAVWSGLFFGLHLVGLAFVDLLLMLVTGVWMFKVAKKVDKKAAWMLVPYLAWLVFAGILNVQGWLNL